MTQKPTVHFVYKSPRHGGLIGRGLDYMGINYPNLIDPIWRRGDHITWKIPKRHPASASFNLIKEFRRRGPLKFYDLWEKGECDIKPGDKFIALPVHVYDGRTWDDPSIQRVTTRTLEKYPDLDATIIMPYCHDELYTRSIRGLLERYHPKAVLLSGEIWTRDWDKSPIKNLVSDILRVNMGIDPNEYPRLKTSFNPKGKRKYLYIGQTAWYKNTKQLEEIAKAMPQFEFGYISQGNIEGWKKIASWADLTTEFMAQVTAEYDFFINTSTADPSPATILEQMCFGLPVACTPESSYEYDSIVRLDVKDIAFNVRQLEAMQYQSEEDLIRIADTNRELAIKNHNWEEISADIANFILK